MTPLLRELVQASRFARHPEIEPMLKEIGLTGEGAPVWGVDNVTVEDGYYDPDHKGRPAVIAPVFEDCRLIDLVATGFASRRIARRTGRGVILGDVALELALFDRETLHLRRDPIEWLQRRATGAVVLDWWRAPFILTDLAGIACTDSALAARVDQALRQPLRVPPLFVPEARRAAA